MRILLGVASEGMGHATRSRAVAEHLRGRGHLVRVASSGRAAALLAAAGFEVLRVEGFSLATRDGVVDPVATLAQGAAALPALLARAGQAFAGADAFAPRAVLTDFEPFAHCYARARGLPLIAIDNIQLLARCELAPGLRAVGAAARPLEAFARCDHHVIPTFAFPALLPRHRADTTLVPPVVRPEVLAARPTHGGHVLVYHTAAGDSRLLAALGAQEAMPFRVYGLRAGAPAPPNCTLRAFDERGFVEDLASARAVVTTGGASLLGECAVLGKPALVVPLAGQPEQLVNAHYVAALGYGASAPAFDAGPLAAFLERTAAYAARLRAAGIVAGNATMFATIDRLLAAAA